MMTMKKRTLLSTALLLATVGFGTTSLAQSGTATTKTDAPAAEAVAKTDTATADATKTDAAASTETAATAEPAKKLTAVPVSPQVEKLIGLYPNLVARIAPYGKVCFEGGECDITITALSAAVDGQPRDGATIYNAVCKTCHDTGLVGAPKLGDTGAWAPRIGKGKAALYNSAINGLNAMPAKGGADIADEEVQNAVDYMVEKSS